MNKLVLSLDNVMELVVRRVSGDLRLYSWERSEVYAESDAEGSLKTEPDVSPLTLSCAADCSVRVPRGVRVTVEQVGGDMRVKALESVLAVGVVGGSLSLRRVLETSAREVRGDFSAKKVDGALRLERVHGDLSARGVSGDFSAGQVGGDLILRDAAGAAEAQVGGDAVLVLDFAAERTFNVQVGGDILCRVSPAASARFTLAGGGDVDVDVPGAQVQGEASQKQVTLGAGSAQVNLRAGGDVSLTAVSADPEAMGEFGEHFGEEFGVMAEAFAAQIETQIESQMAEFEKQMQARMGALDGMLGANQVNAEALAARARRATERASETARRKADHAQRKIDAAQRKVEAAQRRAEAASRRKGFSFIFDAPIPPVPPRPPMPARPAAPKPASEAVTDGERLAILRMVEQGKISVVEAEKLLAALEGQA